MVISVLLSQMTEQLPSCSLLLAPCPLKVELVKQAKLESFYYAVVNGRDTSRPYGYGRRNHNSYLCVICVDLRFLEYEP